MENVFSNTFLKECVQVCSLDFVSLEFGVNFKQGRVGAHLLPPEALEDRGCPWPWGTGCPGANDLMLITGASYLCRGASPLGCHCLSVGSAAESKGRARALAFLWSEASALCQVLSPGRKAGVCPSQSQLRL